MTPIPINNFLHNINLLPNTSQRVLLTSNTFSTENQQPPFVSPIGSNQHTQSVVDKLDQPFSNNQFEKQTGDGHEYGTYSENLNFQSSATQNNQTNVDQKLYGITSNTSRENIQQNTYNPPNLPSSPNDSKNFGQNTFQTTQQNTPQITQEESKHLPENDLQQHTNNFNQNTSPQILMKNELQHPTEDTNKELSHYNEKEFKSEELSKPKSIVGKKTLDGIRSVLGTCEVQSFHDSNTSNVSTIQQKEDNFLTPSDATSETQQKQVVTNTIPPPLIPNPNQNFTQLQDKEQQIPSTQNNNPITPDIVLPKPPVDVKELQPQSQQKNIVSTKKVNQQNQ
ncbi:hypothetical protein QTN25_000947 [Entamoeba marina]